MADAVDMATAIEAEHLAEGIARAAAPIAAGVPGDCEQCEWWMPRLVGGLCAFCRDNRRRPHDWEPPQRPASNDDHSGEENPMAESKSITFIATGLVLAAIKQRTADGVSNNRAALDLVEAGLEAMSAPTTSTVAMPVADIASLPAVDLLDELRLRLAAPVADPVALQEALQRADQAEQRASSAEARAQAAEERLATIRAAFA